ATLQQRLRQLCVRQFRITADVVHPRRLPLLQDHLDPPAMIIDMNPAADVPTVSVQRNLQPVQQVGYEQRNDLLWELKRTVVAAGPRNTDMQSVSSKVRSRQEVPAGFRRSIRRNRI